MSPKWMWEPVNTGESNASGNLAQLYKNEGVEQRGVFAADAPSASATLVAREVIQNSWDAAMELKETDPDAFFEIEFRFLTLSGDEKRKFVSAAGLEELSEREARHGTRALRLAVNNCLQSLDSREPLRLLLVEERGTTGMYGNFADSKSKMYRAMASVGSSAKGPGSGGSYGYGKAGLIRASRTRTVFAYTCHTPRPDDPGVTRRLLGMSYWEGHEEEGRTFKGFGRFGQQLASGSVVPFTDVEADRVAVEIGLRPRDADIPSGLGTSFIVVDPDVEAEGLRKAVERNWWPALFNTSLGFNVTIIDEGGEFHEPRPRRDPILANFVRAYEIATMAQDAQLDWERKAELRIGGRAPQLAGQLGILGDPSGWSFAGAGSGEGDVDHCSLIALVREPHMVVQYFRPVATVPHVRGVFVADTSANELLRETEPKAHDDWATDASAEEVEADAVELAARIKARIKVEVAILRKKLRPPPPDRNDIRLPVFEQLTKRLLRASGTRPEGPGPGKPRDVAISLDYAPFAAGTDTALRALVGLVLAPRYVIGDTAEVRATIKLRVVEGDQRGPDLVDLRCRALQEGFNVSGSDVIELRGPVSREPVTFEVESAPYDHDWSVDLEIDAFIGAEEGVGDG